MATIQSSIKLNDGMTPVLRHITKAMNVMLNSFESVQRASKRAIDTQSLQYAREQIARANVLMDGFERETKEAVVAQQQLATSVNNTTAKLAAEKVLTEKVAQAQEQTKQSVLQTAVAREKAVQATAKTAVQLEKVAQAQEKTKQSTMRTSIVAEKLAQAGEKTKQAFEKTKQAVEKTTQAIIRTKIVQESHKQAVIFTKIATEKLKLAKQKVANAILRNKQLQDQHNNSLRFGITASGRLWTNLKGAAAAYLSMRTAGGIINTSDALTMNTARLDLMKDEGQSVVDLENKIYEASMRSRSSYLDTAKAISQMGIRAGDKFGSNNETIAFVETLNKMATISGSTTAELQSAMLQITQAMGVGQLRGDELRSVGENLPYVLQSITDYLRKIPEMKNITAAEIYELAADGKISADILKNAILSSVEDVDKKIKNMPWTWDKVWAVFKNYAIRAFDHILRGINRIANSKKFQSFANAVGNAMAWLADVSGKAFDLILKGFSKVYDYAVKVRKYLTPIRRIVVHLAQVVWSKLVGAWNALKNAASSVAAVFVSIGQGIRNNWSFIEPIIWGIVGAFAAYKTALFAIALWHGICAGAILLWKGVVATATFIMSLFRIATWKQIYANIAMTVSGWAASSPLLFWIVVITAVIAIFYILIAVINRVCGTSISATGIIAAVFTGMFTVIRNQIALVANVMSAFVEFFANVFKHPTYSVKMLFVNLGLAIVGVMKSIASTIDLVAQSVVDGIEWAINKCIEGINWLIKKLPDKAQDFLGVSGEIGQVSFGKVGSFADTVSGWEASLNAMKSEGRPDDYWEAPKMEYKDVLDSATAAYDWGANLKDTLGDKLSGLGDKVSGLTSNLGDMLSNSMTGVTDYLKKIGGSAEDGADKLNDIGKALSGGYSGDPNLANLAKDASQIAGDVSDINKNVSVSDEHLKYMRGLAEREAINRFTTNNTKVEISNNNNISKEVDGESLIDLLTARIAGYVTAGGHQ